MELVGIAGIAVLLLVGLVGLAIGWWILRRTLSMIKKLVMLGLVLAIGIGVVALAVAGLTYAQFRGEFPDPPAPVERSKQP